MFLAQAYAAGEEGESEENTSEAKAEFEAAMSAANEPKTRTLKKQK